MCTGVHIDMLYTTTPCANLYSVIQTTCPLQ